MSDLEYPATGGAGDGTLGGETHAALPDVTADQHHAQSHTLVSHSTRPHSDLTGIGATDHHSNANDHINSEAAHAWHVAHIDSLTAAEHTAIGDGAPHHAAAHNLASHATRDHADLNNVTATQHHSNANDHANVILAHADTAHTDPPVLEADANWVDLTDGGATALHTHAGGGHPDLSTHDALGLATDAELTTHAGAADPHTGYRLESADHSHQSAGAQAGKLDHGLALDGLADDDHPQYALDTDLSTHAGAADPHTGYVREADANWIDLTDSGATTLHSHSGGGAHALDGASHTATTDITDLDTSVTKHGLFPKLPNTGGGRAWLEDGTWGSPAAGAPALSAFTKDLGAARSSGTFDITGLAGLTADKAVVVVQTAAAIASKGNARDEPEMDLIQLTGYVVNTTTIRCYWKAQGVVVGTYAFAYSVSG